MLRLSCFVTLQAEETTANFSVWHWISRVVSRTNFNIIQSWEDFLWFHHGQGIGGDDQRQWCSLLMLRPGGTMLQLFKCFIVASLMHSESNWLGVVCSGVIKKWLFLGSTTIIAYFTSSSWSCLLLILCPPDPIICSWIPSITEFDGIHTVLVWNFFLSILKSCALDPFFWQMIFGSKKQVFWYLQLYVLLLLGRLLESTIKITSNQGAYGDGIEVFGCSIWILKNDEIQWSETLAGHSRIFWKSGAQCNVARRSWWIDLWIFVDRVSGGCAKRIRDHLSHIPSFDMIEFFFLMFFCKGNKWQASFCSSIFHCFFGRLRLNLSEYQRRGETASPSVRCLKPWSFTLKVWGIVAANQQGLATAANQLEGFICIVVCIEYPFSNCQNVGPFDGDAMWYQVVTWGFIAQLVSFECYHCASHAIFWLQADLAVCPAIFHLIRVAARQANSSRILRTQHATYKCFRSCN